MERLVGRLSGGLLLGRAAERQVEGREKGPVGGRQAARRLGGRWRGQAPKARGRQPRVHVQIPVDAHQAALLRRGPGHEGALDAAGGLHGRGTEHARGRIAGGRRRAEHAGHGLPGSGRQDSFRLRRRCAHHAGRPAVPRDPHEFRAHERRQRSAEHARRARSSRHAHDELHACERRQRRAQHAWRPGRPRNAHGLCGALDSRRRAGRGSDDPRG
mmetsp:Transcript_61468/g.178233  ORF Transcript_61468/g.178233 Transcript_61468/m.178233 type:complete len:215 (-) Transcript_61468:70-714(-)